MTGNDRRAVATGADAKRIAPLAAALLQLRAPLGLLVGVELLGDARDLAVEQVDEGPQEIIEIVLQPHVG